MSLEEILNNLTPKIIKGSKTGYYEKEEAERAIKKAYYEGRKTVWKAIIKFLKRIPNL